MIVAQEPESLHWSTRIKNKGIALYIIRNLLRYGFREIFGLRRSELFHLPERANFVEKSTHCLGRQMCAFFWWGMVDSDHRSQWQQIYSLPPLAAREIPHMKVTLCDPWSWWSESNQQPADYKSAALPLSHTSEIVLSELVSLSQRRYYTTSILLCQAFFEKYFFFFSIGSKLRHLCCRTPFFLASFFQSYWHRIHQPL